MSTKQKKHSVALLALDLINEIYRGITDTKAWDDILEEIVHLAGASKGIISLRSQQSTDMMPSQLPVLAPRTVNIDPFYVGSYLDNYYKIDPWTPFEAEMEGASVIRFSDLLQQDDLRKTVFYKEFLFPQQIEDGFAVLLAKGPDSWVILNLLIGSSPGKPPEEIKELLLLLAPHLQRSFCTAIELSLLKSVNQDLSGLLDKQREGICLLKANGEILYKNTNAKRILKTQDELYVMHGVLHSTHRETDRKLCSLIESACLRNGADSGHLAISRNSESPILQLYVTPYMRNSEEVTTRSQASVILIIAEPAAGTAVDMNTLKHLFELTPAEARLTASLSNGVSLKEYASNQQISFNTARWHLRNIFEKVGVNSQQELLRQTLSGNPLTPS